MLITSPFLWTGEAAPVHHLIPLSCGLPGFRLSFRDLSRTRVSPHRRREGSCSRLLLLEGTAGTSETISAAFVATASLIFSLSFIIIFSLRPSDTGAAVPARLGSRGSIAGRSRGCRSEIKRDAGAGVETLLEQDGGLQTGWGSSGRD